MGSGMAMQAAVNALPVPAGIILCEHWSSLQAAAAATGTAKIFAYALPDYWNNVENTSRINCPILIIHSDSDRIFSLAMSQAIYEKATVSRRIVMVHGFSHTGLYRNANMDYWSPVVDFVGIDEKNKPPLARVCSNRTVRLSTRDLLNIKRPQLSTPEADGRNKHKQGMFIIQKNLNAKKPHFSVRPSYLSAEWTGLEPATPCVTGMYSNQLNYHSVLGLQI